MQLVYADHHFFDRCVDDSVRHIQRQVLVLSPKYITCVIQSRSFSTEWVFVVALICRKKPVELTDRVLTIPNIMSGIRLVLAPVIGVMTVKGLFLPSLCSSFSYSPSHVAFAFASILDFADGYVARHFNQRSRLGTLIDPVADKTLMVCLAVAMGYAGLIHIPVAGIIIGKDLLMGLGFLGIAWKHGYRSRWK